MFQNAHNTFVKLLILIVSVALIATCGVFTQSLYAAQQLSISAPSVTATQVNVEIAFPLVDWSGGFKLLVDFDSSVLEYSTSSCNISGFSFDKNASGNKLTLAGSTSFDEGVLATQKTVISIVFNVKDSSKTTTVISCTPEEFFDYNGNTVVEDSANVTVTLKAQTPVTPPPSSNTETDTSSNTSSTTDTPSDTSTPTSTKTDTTTSTKTETPSTKPPVSTSTKTDTDTGTQSDTVTDSETLTDTETNLPISDTATDTETDVTDITDVTDTPTEENSGAWFSTVITATDEKPNNTSGLSTGMIVLISVGISVVFCGALTAVGLLRHKKDGLNQ